jgi:hypothetical protein
LKKIIISGMMAMFVLSIYSSCKHSPGILPVTTSDTTHNPPPPPPPDTGKKCSPDTIYFQNEVLPLIVSTCAKSGCHDQITHKEGITLTDWSSIVGTGGVDAGNAAGSRLYQSIAGGGDDRMPPPPANPLTSAQINDIAKWINQGARNNKCDSTGCDTVNVTYTKTIQPIVQIFCLGCHSGSSPANGLSLSGYDAVKTAAGGRLMGAIRHQNGYFSMPPGGSLTACQISEFQIWINLNYPQ